MTVVALAGHEIDVTNADRVLFPGEGITKGDVVAYYQRIASLMVPHMAERPLVLERYPDGIDGDGFFQKNASEHFPDWLRTAAVPRRRGGEVHPVICCEDAATLVYLANQATLTFHVWPTTIDDLDHPDLLTFDLDPGQHTGLDAVRAAARALRERLDDVRDTPFIQTTGSRGYHVVAPLDREADVEAARTFSRDLAGRVAADEPHLFTTAQRRAKRGQRVFLDTNRNGYAQHAVAPYSLRARPGAPVATPIDWDELDRVEPASYTRHNVFRRLGQKDDPWAAMADAAGSLLDARSRLG